MTTLTTLREVLDALEGITDQQADAHLLIDQAITDLTALIADMENAEPVQEPVKLTADQKDAERRAFEQWYVENAFDYERDPLGSKLCGDQWAAWKHRAAAPQAKPMTVQSCVTCAHHKKGSNPSVSVYDVDCFECSEYYASKYTANGIGSEK